MIGYDGENCDGMIMMYEKEPSNESVRQEIIDYILDYILYQGEAVGAEIAQYIIKSGINVGAWQSELEEFANEC